LKYLYGNKYIGGYGIRSNIKAYEWMEEQYNMDIIKVAMVDEYLYHLDCSIFALNGGGTLPTVAAGTGTVVTASGLNWILILLILLL